MSDNLLASKQTRINYLDFYKGICILFVIITHYRWTDEQRLNLLFPFWIDMAVPVFMVITGYVSAMSFQNRNQNLKTIYEPKEILCKWLRFIIPFTPVFIAQLVARILVLGEEFSFIEAVKHYILGGTGPGSYYFPVMLQVIIIIPVIWHIVRKFKAKGLIAWFIVNLLFEAWKTLIDMDPGWYPLFSFRYIFILAYGCYLYMIQHENSAERKLWYYSVGFIGFAYIIIFRFTNAEPIITSQWTATSVFAVLYIVPIMMHLMRSNRLHNSVLELLGKASFNICLTQMTYYLAAGRVYNYIPSIILRLVINILACCVLGVLFYMIESPITQWIIKKIRSI